MRPQELSQGLQLSVFVSFAFYKEGSGLCKE